MLYTVVEERTTVSGDLRSSWGTDLCNLFRETSQQVIFYGVKVFVMNEGNCHCWIVIVIYNHGLWHVTSLWSHSKILTNWLLIRWYSWGFFFYSGGIVIGVIGKHLDRVQSPRMIIWYMNTPYENVSAFFYSVFIFRLNEDSLWRWEIIHAEK